MARYTLTFVNDELKAPLDAAITFAATEGLAAIEMRSIEGRNLLALEADELGAIAGRLRAAGLRVAGLASPLLKWAPPGRAAGPAGDQFGFDLAGRSLGEMGRAVAATAHQLGTRNVRIFTYLTYDGFAPVDLDAPLAELLAMAEQEDLVLHVENEPVCNIRSVGELAALMRRHDHPRLRALLDIGNACWAGLDPTPAELEAVMPYVDRMHFKDYDRAGKRIVALGEGDIPYALHLATCLAAARGRPLDFSIETHVPDDQPAATRRSLHHLRSLLDAHG